MLPNAYTSAGARAGAGPATRRLAGLGSIGPGLIGFALAGLMAAATASAQTATTPNLGNLKVGSSVTAPVTVIVATAGTPAQIKVVTQGIEGLDFTDAGGDACAVGTPYAAGATCAVNVKFAPQYAGQRMGAVVLADASGNPLGTAYVMGTGLAGQVGFYPGGAFAYIGISVCGMKSNGAPVSADVGGVAVDARGNVYLTCPLSGDVYKEAPEPRGTWTQTQIGTNILAQDGLNEPTGIAVDGAGNVYIADATQNRVVMDVPTVAGYAQVDLAIAGLSQPQGIAVDAVGNLYIADYFHQRVVEAQRTASGYTVVELATQLNQPVGVAVDGAGNVFATEGPSQQILEISNCVSACAPRVLDTLPANVEGIAVDGSGNVYVTCPNDVFVELASNGSYKQVDLGLGKINNFSVVTPLLGLAVDGAGTVYQSYQTAGTVQAYMAATPVAAAAGNATLGVNSGTIAEYGLMNVGNEPLAFKSVSYPPDFPQGPPESNDTHLPANATVDGECAAGMNLPTGQICLASIEFYPLASMNGQVFNSLNENVALTSDAPAELGNSEMIPVSGLVAEPDTTALLAASADPGIQGQPVTLTVTLTAPGVVTPTGTVAFNQLINNAWTLLANVPVSNSQAAYTLSGLAVGTTQYSANYSGDENYPGVSSKPLTLSVVPAQGVKDFGNEDLGTENLGTAGSSTPLNITFTAAETLGGIAVLTQGAPNLDFQGADGGTCTLGHSYAAGDACTVNVVFKPTAPGSRYGAVVLTDGGGRVFGTGYLHGMGVGPQAAFMPATNVNVASTSTFYPFGVAVDGAGNIYVVAAGLLYELTPNNGVYTRTTIPTEGFHASGVVVDGAGNLFVTDNTQYTGGVYKVSPSAGGYITASLGYGMLVAQGMAVDGAGNVFVAGATGLNAAAVFKLAPSQGTYVQSTIDNLPSLAYAAPNLTSVAVDGAGDLYVGEWDALGNNLFKGTPAGGGYTWTTIAKPKGGPPQSVAVDGIGNVYVATNDEVGDGLVLKETPQSDGSYSAATLPAGEAYPTGVAVDSLGNVYVSGVKNGITELNASSAPALAFATTNWRSTSTDSPKAVTLTNNGNAALTISAVTYPADFPEAGGTTGDCKAGALAQGANCTLTIDFSPQATGALGASVPLTENVTVTAGNLTAPVNIPVSGTETIPANPTIAMAGTALSLAPGATTGNTSTITVTPGGGFTGSVALTAAVTSSPQGAQYLPTVSFGSTTPVNIGGTSAATATMTIATTAASTAGMKPPGGARIPWYRAGSVLACLLVILVPGRRQGWKALLGMIAIALTLGAVASCGGGGSTGGGGGGGGGIAGTTAGSYTITVTGSSGSVTTQCTVALTVQ